MSEGLAAQRALALLSIATSPRPDDDRLVSDDLLAEATRIVLECLRLRPDDDIRRHNDIVSLVASLTFLFGHFAHYAESHGVDARAWVQGFGASLAMVVDREDDDGDS